MSQHCLLCRAWTACPKPGEVTPKRFKNSIVVKEAVWRPTGIKITELQLCGDKISNYVQMISNYVHLIICT